MPPKAATIAKLNKYNAERGNLPSRDAELSGKAVGFVQLIAKLLRSAPSDVFQGNEPRKYQARKTAFARTFLLARFFASKSESFGPEDAVGLFNLQPLNFHEFLDLTGRNLSGTRPFNTRELADLFKRFDIPIPQATAEKSSVVLVREEFNTYINEQLFDVEDEHIVEGAEVTKMDVVDFINHTFMSTAPGMAAQFEASPWALTPTEIMALLVVQIKAHPLLPRLRWYYTLEDSKISRFEPEDKESVRIIDLVDLDVTDMLKKLGLPADLPALPPMLGVMAAAIVDAEPPPAPKLSKTERETAARAASDVMLNKFDTVFAEIGTAMNDYVACLRSNTEMDADLKAKSIEECTVRLASMPVFTDKRTSESESESKRARTTASMASAAGNDHAPADGEGGADSAGPSGGADSGGPSGGLLPGGLLELMRQESGAAADDLSAELDRELGL